MRKTNFAGIQHFLPIRIFLNMILTFSLTVERAFPSTVGSLVRALVGRGFLRSHAAILASRCRHRVLSAAARTYEGLGLSCERGAALAAFFGIWWVQYSAGASIRFGNSRRTKAHKQTHLFSRYPDFSLSLAFDDSPLSFARRGRCQIPANIIVCNNFNKPAEGFQFSKWTPLSSILLQYFNNSATLETNG